ncbi:MAG: GGDEF domain-containing protein [Deltaproteobacteria bacterium]|nr:GGDEF domain-containing protein [Deltaproteobacteria bacterium]
MFWSRSSSKPAAAPEGSVPPQGQPAVRDKGVSQAPRAGDEAEAAIDTVGAMLRTLGKHAIQVADADPAQVACEFEDWARHVLVRAPRPGRAAPTHGEVVRRDWAGLRVWLQGHRKAESESVEKAIADLRGALWALVRCFARALSEDGESDGQVNVQLQRLKGVVELDNPEEIKREAVAIAECIGEVLVSRKARQASRLEELAERLKALDNELEDAKRESATDPLTRLFNRGAFDEHLSRMLDMSCLTGQRICLLLIDIDHFKLVNDKYGHPGGDAVLRELADCITRSFLRRGDFVARYGGEEFAVVVSEVAAEDGVKLAERLRLSISRMVVRYNSAEIRITASIGVAAVVAGRPAAEWLARADRALYAAKKAGRNRVLCDDDVRAGASESPRKSA